MCTVFIKDIQTTVFLSAQSPQGKERIFSPVGVRTNLHNAPGAALLTFFQLVVNDQLSRLQHTHRKTGYCEFLYFL